MHIANLNLLGIEMKLLNRNLRNDYGKFKIKIGFVIRLVRNSWEEGEGKRDTRHSFPAIVTISSR